MFARRVALSGWGPALSHVPLRERIGSTDPQQLPLWSQFIASGPRKTRGGRGYLSMFIPSRSRKYWSTTGQRLRDRTSCERAEDAVNAM